MLLLLLAKVLAPPLASTPLASCFRMRFAMAGLQLLVVSTELADASSLRGRETGVLGGDLKVVAGLSGRMPGATVCCFFWAFDRVFTVRCDGKTKNHQATG